MLICTQVRENGVVKEVSKPMEFSHCTNRQHRTRTVPPTTQKTDLTVEKSPTATLHNQLGHCNKKANQNTRVAHSLTTRQRKNQQENIGSVKLKIVACGMLLQYLVNKNSNGRHQNPNTVFYKDYQRWLSSRPIKNSLIIKSTRIYNSKTRNKSILRGRRSVACIHHSCSPTVLPLGFQNSQGFQCTLAPLFG